MDATAQSPKHNLPKELREVSVVQMTDPTAVRGTIDVLDQDVVNLDPKGFEVKRITVPMEVCCLIYTRTNSAVRTRTLIHEEFEACTILGPESHGTIDGKELHPHKLIAAAPGAQAEIIVDSGYESVALLVPPRVLDKHLALRRIKTDFDFPENHALWRADKKMAHALFELGAQIAETAERSPEIFDDNQSIRLGAQIEFLDALIATIESCDSIEMDDADIKGKSYSQIVRASEDYTMNLEERRPYLSELCATSGVSERTLQYAFQSIMGMSPLTYLHRLRLHRARNELRKARSGSTTITDVAMNWGFWHFGDFSRAYKNCFGEVPSTTLRSNPAD